MIMIVLPSAVLTLGVFMKLSGLTGVELGLSAVPRELKKECSSNHIRGPHMIQDICLI